MYIAYFLALQYEAEPGDKRTREIFRSLKQSPSLQGFTHLGNDGVVRSFSSKGEVVDYRPLSPEEIDWVLLSFSRNIGPEDHQKASSILRGKDGRKVTDMKQILHPGREVVDLEQYLQR